MVGWKSARLVTYGFLLGTAGIKILSSKDAKKVYTHVTAAAMRCVDEVVKVGTAIKENCEDISTDAKEINEQRYAKERASEIEDARARLEALEAECADAAQS